MFYYMQKHNKDIIIAFLQKNVVIAFGNRNRRLDLPKSLEKPAILAFLPLLDPTSLASETTALSQLGLALEFFSL